MSDRPGVTRRDGLIDVVAFLVALDGALAILYAGFLPLQPFTDTPVPLAWQAYGLAGLVAGVGVGLRRAWGRVLGIVVGCTWLALAVLHFAYEVGRSTGAASIVDVAIPAATTVPVLWVLTRRWPARDPRR